MKILLHIVLMALSTQVYAEKEQINVDPFDLSASQSKVKELGVITKTEVDALEEKAKKLFNSGNCKSAVPALKEYSKKSNWLANLIASSLKPYYSASYDDRKSYPYEKLKPLIPLEKLSNDYKQKRNIALAMHGECLLKLGNKDEAVPVLIKALDLINIDNEAWWKRTRDNLLSIIEVKI